MDYFSLDCPVGQSLGSGKRSGNHPTAVVRAYVDDALIVPLR
jgi:hypothetical protein